MRGRLGPVPYVFAVLGGIIAVLALTLFWARTVVLDEDEFAARAVEAAEEDVVKAEIGRVVVDKLIEAEPVLRVSRPVLQRAADVAVQTRTFERLIEPAARDVHQTAFDEGKQEMILDFTGLVDLIVEEVDRVENRINIIDLNLESNAGEIALEDIEELRTAARAAETADTFTPVLPVVAAALLIAGVLLAGRWAFGVGGFAAGMVVGGIAIWGSLLILRSRMDGSFESDDTREAANIAWDVYMEPLPWLLIGAGVLAVAVTVVAVVAGRVASRSASEPTGPEWA